MNNKRKLENMMEKIGKEESEKMVDISIHESEVVTVKGISFKVMAVNDKGWLILHPVMQDKNAHPEYRKKSKIIKP